MRLIFLEKIYNNSFYGYTQILIIWYLLHKIEAKIPKIIILLYEVLL